MAISFQCTCGRDLRVKDELAGRRVRCPNCSSILTIPKAAQPDIEYNAGDVLLAETPGNPEKEPESEESEVPTSTAIADRPLYRAPPPEKKRRPLSNRKVAQRERESRGLPIAFEEGWFGSMNAGVIGGLLMIVIAIAWFVAGLMGGIIFFYPPILLIIGVGAAIKGLTGSD